mgnify:FL=1
MLVEIYHIVIFEVREVVMNILFVNACVREESRTKKIAEHLFEKIKEDQKLNIDELDLEKEDIKPLTKALLDKRDGLLADGRMDDEMFRYARQFAAADEIVIAAPFWDLSFPALVKDYIENVNVCGVTFMYKEKGERVGLCNAKHLVYITTAGGPIFSDEFGYGYIRSLCEMLYGIPETCCIKAEGLDIYGADVEGIMAEAYRDAENVYVAKSI